MTQLSIVWLMQARSKFFLKRSGHRHARVVVFIKQREMNLVAMRITTMRNTFSLALLVTALAASGCGDSPTRPSAPAAPPVSPAAPEVKITAVGVVYAVPTYRNADAVPAYRIDGVGQNVGAGCVSEITGTTTIEGVSVSWAVAHPVTSGSQFWYTAKLELPNAKLAARVVDYTTTFRAKSGC